VTERRPGLVHRADTFWGQQRVQGLYERAGPHEEAFRLRGMTPTERAEKAWARLRHHNVDPRLVVAAWLAVEMATADDATAEHKSEYKQVQAAKIVHRLASGTHKGWNSGQSGRTELHVYPASRGLVLRHIGASLEGALELITPRALPQLLASMRATEKRKNIRPHHRSLRSRARVK
jgi:hypothetical protein